MKMTACCATVAALLLAVAPAIAEEVTVDINKISADGVGDKIGAITVSDNGKGVTFKVSVTGVSAGEHGFHVHEKGDCGPGEKDGKKAAGVAAGDHYDPKATKTHAGPEGQGHAGDAPKLKATDKGIDQTVSAPRLKLADIRGRALVIHEGGDNYSDKPEPLGGGKGRIACGVVPKG